MTLDQAKVFEIISKAQTENKLNTLNFKIKSFHASNEITKKLKR